MLLVALLSCIVVQAAGFTPLHGHWVASNGKLQSGGRHGGLFMVNKPPGREGILIGVRESIEYLLNGDQFIADRHKEFGPIFSTTLFFRPTVVVGGQKSVAEFLSVDRDIAESSLPPPLQELMTERNTLLQTGDKHSASRRMMSPVLDLEALKTYLPIIEKRAEDYVNMLSKNDSTLLARDLTKFCLQLFSEIFTGHQLSSEQVCGVSVCVVCVCG